MVHIQSRWPAAGCFSALAAAGCCVTLTFSQNSGGSGFYSNPGHEAVAHSARLGWVLTRCSSFLQQSDHVRVAEDSKFALTG